jgi:dienelactone hydrolase
MHLVTMLAALAWLALVSAGCGASATGQQASAASRSAPSATEPSTARLGTASSTTETSITETSTTTPARPRSDRRRLPARSSPPFHVGERILTFVDYSRQIRLPGRAPGPRRLVTVIRYPEHAAGPFPLIIFGHGFAVTPAPYFRLLRAWASAGYVVAAPVFPLENANAPNGPDESDLVNQPRDMRFVITRMLAAGAAPRGPFAGLLAPDRIAVSGQSDGGETALAVAYDRYYRDRRVSAAIILSGAEIPGVGGFDFPAPSPPLLATQGTADTINAPHFTSQFFAIAPRPKYLLELLGAGHLPPYTYEQPQLSIVERVTIAFLDRYLKESRDALQRMRAAGDEAGLAKLVALP